MEVSSWVIPFEIENLIIIEKSLILICVEEKVSFSDYYSENLLFHDYIVVIFKDMVNHRKILTLLCLQSEYSI